MRWLQQRYDTIYQRFWQDSYQCQLRLEQFSWNNIVKYFHRELGKIGMAHAMIVDLITANDLAQLKEICQWWWPWDQVNDMEQVAKELMDQLDKLESPQYQSWNSQKPQYDNIDPAKYDEHYQQLEKDSVWRTNEMLRLRSTQWYNIKSFINDLFIDFFGKIK